jgi:hypothetical protein
MEAPMTQQDPFNPRPQRPDLDPLPSGSNQSRYRDIDRTDWNSGVIAAAIVAAVIVIGLIVWASTSGQQTATNPPAQTTGQGTSPPTPPAPK